MKFTDNMPTTTKIVLVASGYAVAFAAAALVVALRTHTAPPDAQASQGMSAFGDAVVFLWVLGFLGVFPTAAAVYFARPSVHVGSIFSRLALFVAVSGVGALLILLATSGPARRGSVLPYWNALAIVRLLPSPLVAGVFALCCVIARERSARRRWLIAAAIESIAAVYVVLEWFIPARFN